MARSEYRNAINSSADGIINDIETDVNNLLEFVEGIDVENTEDLKEDIDTIIADLKELAEKLY
jgi:hypothetical protein